MKAVTLAAAVLNGVFIVMDLAIGNYPLAAFSTAVLAICVGSYWFQVKNEE